MAHWPDVGGTLGGVTTDIYSEGLQLPIVKYARAGVVSQDIHDIIRINVRLPERAMGDLRAQVTAIKTGERRFLELLDRYGQGPVLDCIRVLMDHAEAAARERTRAIPDGVYEAESFMDDDAIDVAKRIPIRVKVIVSGDEMTVDLTDVAKQVSGFYNSGPTTGIACAQVAFKCVTSPTDYPVNDGSFRNLKVVLPPGSIVSAVRPAPMRWWMTFPMTVVDTIFKALSKAIPDQVIAGHHADLCVALLDGFHADTGKLFITSFGPLGGGWGAKRGEDGVSATVCINDGDTHNSPNEQFEAKYPVMVESLSLITDSGGPGRYRGGLGVETVVQALTDFNVNTSIERAVCLPWGLEGGLEGTGNEMLLRRDGVIDDDVPNAKVFRAKVKAGDAYVLRSGGGGGFRLAAGAAGRERAARRAAGLCLRRGRARLLRRDAGPRDACDRRCGNRPAARATGRRAPQTHRRAKRGAAADRAQDARRHAAGPSVDPLPAAVLLRALACAARF